MNELFLCEFARLRREELLREAEAERRALDARSHSGRQDAAPSKRGFLLFRLFAGRASEA
jgi:hypothetical protein